MRDAAETIMTTDNSQAMAAWGEYIRALDRVGSKLEEVARKGSGGGESISRSWMKMLPSIVSVSGALKIVLDHFEAIEQANRRLQERGAAITVPREASLLHAATQLGLDDHETRRLHVTLDRITQQVPASFQQAAFASAAAGEYGLDKEEVLSGRIPGGFLEALDVTGQLKDPETGDSQSPAEVQDMFAAFAQYLTAKGIPLTAKNLEAFYPVIEKIFRGRPVQTPDLVELAKSAGAFGEAGVQFENMEDLAAFATLRRSLPAEQARIGLRNFVMVSAEAASGKGADGKPSDKQKLLRKLGVDPKKLRENLNGDFGAALDQYWDAIKDLEGADRLAAVMPLFERQNSAAALALIQDRANYRESLAMIESATPGNAEYQAAIARSRASVPSRKILAEQAEEASLHDPQFVDADIWATRVRAEMTEAGTDPIDVDRWEERYRSLLYIGRTPRAAAYAAAWGHMSGTHNLKTLHHLERWNPEAQQAAVAAAERALAPPDPLIARRARAFAEAEDANAAAAREVGAAADDFAARKSAEESRLGRPLSSAELERLLQELIVETRKVRESNERLEQSAPAAPPAVMPAPPSAPALRRPWENLNP